MTAPTDVAASQLGTAAAAKTAQVTISVAAMRDAAQLWPLLDAKRLDATFPAWLRAMTLLVRRYHSQSSLAAGAAYRAARQLHTQSPAPRSLIKIAPEPPDEWLSRAFGFSGPGMLSRDTVRPNTALSTTLGTASRIVLDGGRTTTINTVHADPVAVGWYRLTDATPCAFCALMASRGVVYKSEKTADFKAHDRCHCSAVPAFSRDHELPDLNREADRIYREATKGVPSGQQIAAFRKAWDQRQS